MNHPNDEETQAAIRQFRDAAHNWRVPAPPALLFGAQSPKPRVPAIQWVLAAAVALLLAAIPFYRGTTRPQPANIVADAALLNQIDAQLSRDTPAPMEPLLNLVSWSATSSERTEK